MLYEHYEGYKTWKGQLQERLRSTETVTGRKNHRSQSDYFCPSEFNQHLQDKVMEESSKRIQALARQILGYHLEAVSKWEPLLSLVRKVQGGNSDG